MNSTIPVHALARAANGAVRLANAVNTAADSRNRARYGSAGKLSVLTTCAMLALDIQCIFRLLGDQVLLQDAENFLQKERFVCQIHLVAQTIEAVVDVISQDLTSEERWESVEKKFLASLYRLAAVTTELECVRTTDQYRQTPTGTPESDALARKFREYSAFTIGFRVFECIAQFAGVSKVIDVSVPAFTHFAFDFYRRSIHQARVAQDALQTQPEEGQDEEEMESGLDQYQTIPEHLWSDSVFSQYRCTITGNPARFPVVDPTDPEGRLYERAELEKAHRENRGEGHPHPDQVQTAYTAQARINRRLAEYQSRAAEWLNNNRLNGQNE